MLRTIADAVCSTSDDLVVEIGPGRGALTKHLLERASRVKAIELDPSLVEHLRSKFSDAPNLEVIHADVLRTALHQWGAAAIAGNLPYYITSPIIERILRSPWPEHGSWSRAVLLVQKEVADRLLAQPGTRDYGYLTVQTNLFASVKKLVRVPPSAFNPPPKVDSAAVIMEPHSQPLAADPPAFLKFAGRCFRQKRKTLRNNLSDAYGKDALASIPEASKRAEQLSLPELLELFACLQATTPGRSAL